MTRPPPRRRTIEILHLRIVEDFPDEQPPSLPAIPVEGVDITDRPGVVQTRRVYIPVSSLRPECCFEVTRTPHPNGPEYTAELISGDVDCDELVDAEALAIDQARDEWNDRAASARITAEGRFRNVAL